MSEIPIGINLMLVGESEKTISRVESLSKTLEDIQSISRGTTGAVSDLGQGFLKATTSLGKVRNITREVSEDFKRLSGPKDELKETERRALATFGGIDVLRRGLERVVPRMTAEQFEELKRSFPSFAPMIEEVRYAAIGTEKLSEKLGLLNVTNKIVAASFSPVSRAIYDLGRSFFWVGLGTMFSLMSFARLQRSVIQVESAQLSYLRALRNLDQAQKEYSETQLWGASTSEEALDAALNLKEAQLGVSLAQDRITQTTQANTLALLMFAFGTVPTALRAILDLWVGVMKLVVARNVEGLSIDQIMAKYAGLNVSQAGVAVTTDAMKIAQAGAAGTASDLMGAQAGTFIVSTALAGAEAGAADTTTDLAGAQAGATITTTALAGSSLVLYGIISALTIAATLGVAAFMSWKAMESAKKTIADMEKEFKKLKEILGPTSPALWEEIDMVGSSMNRLASRKINLGATQKEIDELSKKYLDLKYSLVGRSPLWEDIDQVGSSLEHLRGKSPLEEITQIGSSFEDLGGKIEFKGIWREVYSIGTSLENLKGKDETVVSLWKNINHIGSSLEDLEGKDQVLRGLFTERIEMGSLKAQENIKILNKEYLDLKESLERGSPAL